MPSNLQSFLQRLQFIINFDSFKYPILKRFRDIPILFTPEKI